MAPLAVVLFLLTRPEGGGDQVPIGGVSAEVPVIVAASDLKFALEEVAARFTAQTRRGLKLVFGSSGHFARQIEQGAPFQMFLSSDEDLVFKLAEAGKTVDRGVLYAIGRIGIMVPHGSPLKADPELKDLAAALAEGRIKKFAIADPEHAPHGKRAEEALRHAGLWDRIKEHLVLGKTSPTPPSLPLPEALRGASSPTPWRCHPRSRSSAASRSSRTPGTSLWSNAWC